jgi:hypothetical protein
VLPSTRMKPRKRVVCLYGGAEYMVQQDAIPWILSLGRIHGIL